MLEFDVLDLVDGTLVLAHSERPARGEPRRRPRARAPARVSQTSGRSRPGCRRSTRRWPSAPSSLPGIGLQLDLKRRGIEAGVVEALRRHEVLDRSWVSTFDARSLRRIAELEPEPAARLHAAPRPLRDLQARPARAGRARRPGLDRGLPAPPPAGVPRPRPSGRRDAPLLHRLQGGDRAGARARRGGLRLDGRRPEAGRAARRATEPTESSRTIRGSLRCSRREASFAPVRDRGRPAR